MIVVTGATGFIGSAFVWELNSKGFNEIICVDVQENLNDNKNLHKRKFNEYLSKNKLITWLNSNSKKIETIVHMGACSDTTETNRDFIMETNFEYTKLLWDWCTKNKVNFIYASSAATYGDGTLGYDDETSPELLKPLNLYGESKLLFDNWALKQKRTPPHWVGIKFFNVYGPQEYHKNHMASVAYKAFHQIQETGKLKLFKSHNKNYADGKQMRDFIYIKDCTAWMYEIINILKHKTNINGIFNMGTGVSRTWLDLAKITFETLDKPLKIDWIEVPENIRNQYQYFTQAKMDKFYSTGLPKFSWPIELGVKDYVKNYLMNKDPYL